MHTVRNENEISKETIKLFLQYSCIGDVPVIKAIYEVLQKMEMDQSDD